MQKDLHINQNDYTPLATRYGYSVSYTKRQGQQGGMMLSGKETEDVLAIKAVVTVPVRPMFESEVNQLIKEVLSVDYPLVYYFDPRANAYREVEMIAGEPSAQHVGYSVIEEEIWRTGELTFTER